MPVALQIALLGILTIYVDASTVLNTYTAIKMLVIGSHPSTASSQQLPGIVHAGCWTVLFSFVIQS